MSRATRPPRADTLALALAAALLGAGCGGARARTPAPAPPAAPAPPIEATAPVDTGLARPGVAAGAPGEGLPRATGVIGAPWDTAATSRDSRRLHVYPEGPSAIGQRLVDSLPEPEDLERGVHRSGAAEPPPAASSASPTPAPQPAAPAKDSGPPPPGRCWEVQLLATVDKGRAQQVRDQVEKQLDIAAWVRQDGSIYKVRCGGCLTVDGAGRLAQRLKLEGWPEAFRTPREP